jgi:hypothetical protein
VEIGFLLNRLEAEDVGVVVGVVAVEEKVKL